MKKYNLFIAFFVFLSVFAKAQTPVVSTFTPNTGTVGSTVTITGSGFDGTSVSNNQVYFGSAEATVLTATFSKLTVSVPAGATTNLISVLNRTTKKTGYSNNHFNGVFCNTPLTTTTYNTYDQELSGYGAYNIDIYDMDGDGKSDIISCRNDGRITIALNGSSVGTMNFSAFNIVAGKTSQQFFVADFDGNGKRDILISGNTGLFIIPNYSTSGNLSFGSVITVNTSRAYYQCAAGDLNNDGKIDIIGGANNGTGIIYSFMNTSSGINNFSFSANTATASAGCLTRGLQCVDLDGDGRSDIVGTTYDCQQMFAVRNTTTTNSTTFSFAGNQFFACPGRPYRLKLGDFDKDGRIDLVAPLYISRQTGIFRNTSTVGNINFSSLITLPAVYQNYRVGVGDVNGDGFPDIVTKPNGIGTIFQVYKNTTTGSGSISFNNPITYSSSAGAEVGGIAIGDMDGDLVPDIATSGISTNRIRFHRNSSSQVDTTDPVAICKNITAALGSTGSVVVNPSDVDGGSSDGCGIGSYQIGLGTTGTAQSSLTFTCSDIGTTTVTLYITDNSGNTSSCAASVTIAPAAIIVAGQTTVCQGQTVNLSANSGDSYQWYKDATAISGATSQTYVATVSGSYTVAVTNTGGCSGTSAAVSVVVNTNPTVSVSPASVAHFCSGSALLSASASSLYQWKKGGTDISGATQQTYSATTAGTYSVQVIDLFGCTATSSGIVVSNNPPEIDIAGNSTSISNGDVTPSAADHTDFGTLGSEVRTYTISNTGSGNLHIDAISISGTNASDFTIGGLSLPADIANGSSTTFTVTYGLATVGTSSATVNLDNNDCDEGSYSFAIYGELACTNPTFTSCPSNIKVGTDDDECNAVVTYSVAASSVPAPTLSYGFTGATSGSGSGTGSGSTFNSGVTTVTVTATNICTSTTCSFTVTVTDDEDPIIDGVNQNLTVTFEGSNATSPPSYTEQGITFLSLYGTSSHVHLTDRNNDGSTDLWNHSSCCSTPYRLTVGNNVSFTLVSMEVTEITANAKFFVYPSGASVTITGTGTYTFPSGFANVTEIRWSQTSGRMAIDNVVVSTKTSGSCPADITKVNETDTCGAHVTYAATASDNCSASISFSPTSGSFFPVGTTEVTTTATDAAGNTSTCKFDVTVNDVQDPTITCVGNQSKVADNGVCTYTTSGTEFDPTADDNCGVKTLTNNFNNNASLSGATFSLGATTVIWTATDTAGNSKTCSFVVTVTDDQDPTISCVGNQSKVADNGVCTYTVSGTEFDPTATNDNCSIASVTNDFNSSSSLDDAVFSLGSTTVTWTITDGSGNTETCSYNVVVTDDQDPTITCVGNQTKAADNGVCTYTVSGTEFDPTATNDNCSIASVTNDFNSSSSLDDAVFSLGSTTVTWTITDGSGNTETCSYNVVVTDDQDPTITCVGNQTKVADNGVCTYTVSGTEFDPTATNDNCSIASVTNDFNSSSSLASAQFGLGSTTVTWTITDGSGNTETCSYNVIVTDDQKPTITCASNNTRQTQSGVCTYTIAGTEFDPTTTADNCSVASVTNSINIGSSLNGEVFALGTTTVTWTVVDGSGNSETCTVDVKVEDVTLPTVLTQNATVTLSSGAASIDEDDINNGSNDACGIASVSVSPSTFDCDDIGTNTVTLTVVDANGNTNTGTATVTVVGVAPSCSITSSANTSGTVIGNSTTYAATNQMFLGYGAQSMNINCTATGGGGFSYAWTGTGLSSTTVSNPVFTPSVAGNYTLECTITNSYGCTATCKIVICVIDVVSSKGSKKNPKVLICHVPKGNTSNYKTLSISVNAVPAHLGLHGGCSLAPCGESCSDNKSYKYKAPTGDLHHIVYGSKEADLIVYPNPSVNSFNFILESPMDDLVNLKIYDVSGRLITTMTDLTPNDEVNFGSGLPTGMYFVTFTQVDFVKTIKIIKESNN